MTKKKKIGLILGKGNLAIYCMEQLVHLGYEIVVARLPCNQVKIIKNIAKEVVLFLHSINKNNNKSKNIVNPIKPV